MLNRKSLLLLGFLLAFGATTPGTTRGGVEVDHNIVLPVTIDKTWYRSEKVRLLGKAYEQSGSLTVSDAGLAFSGRKGSFTILRESIATVELGKLSPDIQNEWVIVRYQQSGGESVAAFKGALFSGGKDSQIFSAILKMMESATAE